MKRLWAILLCLACIPAAGCIVVDDKPGHGHGRRYYGHASHVHCVGCGHVAVKGVWYFER